MDLIMEVTDLSNHEIWSINETRKHLKNIYLSDIITLDGRRIGRHVIYGYIQDSSYNWPRDFPNRCLKAKWKKNNDFNLKKK